MNLLKQNFNFRKILFLGLTLNNFTSMAFVVLQEGNKTSFYLFSTAVILYTVKPFNTYMKFELRDELNSMLKGQSEFKM